MPSFDVVSKTDLAEVDNALNGVEREIKQRFDLANTKCAVVRSDDSLTLTADDAMKMTQVEELLKKYLAMRRWSWGRWTGASRRPRQEAACARRCPSSRVSTATWAVRLPRK